MKASLASCCCMRIGTASLAARRRAPATGRDRLYFATRRRRVAPDRRRAVGIEQRGGFHRIGLEPGPGRFPRQPGQQNGGEHRNDRHHANRFEEREPVLPARRPNHWPRSKYRPQSRFRLRRRRRRMKRFQTARALAALHSLPFVLSFESFSRMKARISSAMSSSLDHCSL